MKKTTLLVFLVIALAAVAWYTVAKQKDTRMPASLATYAIDDVSRVYKFGLVYPDGKKIRLVRTPDGWMYNGRKANQSTVNTFLNTVKQLRILYATPKSMKQTMLKSLATNRVKVEIYDKNNKLLQKFYVGARAQDGNSTYFIKENSNEPHLVGVPGHVGSIRPNLIRPEDSDWIDKTIFAYRPDDIRSVSVEYPRIQNRSFKVSRQNGDYKVSPFYPGTPVINQPPIRHAVEDYLAFYRRIVAEAYVPDQSIPDSLNHLGPFAIIRLDTENGTHTVRYYPYLPKGYSLENVPPADRDPHSPIGVNRYFAVNENGDCYITQHRVGGKILWQYPDFFGYKSHPKQPKQPLAQ